VTPARGPQKPETYRPKMPYGFVLVQVQVPRWINSQGIKPSTMMDCSQSNQSEMNPANHRGAKWRYESSSWPIAPALGQHTTTNDFKETDSMMRYTTLEELACVPAFSCAPPDGGACFRSHQTEFTHSRVLLRVGASFFVCLPDGSACFRSFTHSRVFHNAKTR